MPLVWSLLIAVVAGWFVSKLMSGGDFEINYCIAAFAGAFLFPYVIALLSLHMLNREVSLLAFEGLQPRCAGAFIGCLVFDGVKRLS